MFICERCVREHKITPAAPWNQCVACCEICGPVRGCWQVGVVIWTDRISRGLLGGEAEKAHVLVELAAYKQWDENGREGVY